MKMRTYLYLRFAQRPLAPAVVGLLLLGLTAAGCSHRPKRVSAVDIDIPAVCAQLVEDNDTNGDGLLTEQELASVPPINASFREMDTDNDGQVSETELQARFEGVFSPKVGMISAACHITNKGRPVPNAVVHFIPASYLHLDSADMPIASGVTSTQGVAQMEIHPDYLPPDAPKIRGLLRPGFYLVEVTSERTNIPPQYNSETTLGVEVSPDTTIGGPLRIALDY